MKEPARPTPDLPRGIELEGVRFRYLRSSRWRLVRRRRLPVDLECSSLRVEPGLTLLLGPNGSGKSTLLKLVAGIEAPESGTIAIDGRDLWRDERAARQCLAYVPEQPDLSPYVALGEVMRLVCSLRSVAPSEGEQALERVGLGALAHRSVRELSMGQRRRALLAAAFIGETTTLLLDEPLVALDLEMRAAVLSWLSDRLGGGATALVSTHEIDPFLAQVESVIVMRGGQPVSMRPAADGEERSTQLESWARGTN